MEEMYYEQIVEKDNEKTVAICRLAVVAGSIALFVAGYLLVKGILFLLGIIVALAGFMVIIPRCYVEYEYLYMSKELSIDRIYNKESRAKAGSWDLSGMKLMAQEGSAELRTGNGKETVLDFTSGYNDRDVYVIVLGDKNNTHIRFEPNEEILRAIQMQLPRQARY